MPFVNPGPDAIRALSKSVETVAVVGFSAKLQKGAVDEEAADKAAAGGMTVVMDRCMLRDCTRLCLE